ncbi:ABC transporter substrate-binding protein [Paenibacillus gansuensis]|uniref:ABC transporter substrate-binding protein n=1 Tax=Paenibacillus gansuensis TaxID=306542 RepID=A0ABW5PBE5_9BACL
MGKRKIGVMLSILCISSTLLAACSDSASKSSVNSNTAQTKDGITSDRPAVNKDKMFRMTGTWPKPPLYQGNLYAAGGVGIPFHYIYEGLFQNVRSTDKVYNILAESYEHKGNQTVIKLRQNAKWNDGKPFTSKDVWAFYTLNHGVEVTHYVKSIEYPDDYTVIFNWFDKSPSDEVKIKMIGQDMVASIPYHIYKAFVDRDAALLAKAKPHNDPNKKTPYGLDLTQIAEEVGKVWQDFMKSNPKFPITTGPFMVKKVTNSDLLMEKNPYYWNLENIHFDKFAMKDPGPDPAAGFALLRSGKIDYMEHTPPKDILDSILAANEDLVHYKTFDPACVGMIFNTTKAPFNNVEFRKALIYALDREKLRDVGNIYGEVPKTALTGMAPSETKKWVTDDVKSKLTDYSYNPEKAAEILNKLGWSKGTDGKWRDPQGKLPEFIIAVNSSWVIGVNPGQVAAEQLTKFGIPTKLLAVDGSIFYKKAEQGEYQMAMDFTDTTWGTMFPWSPLRNQYWGLLARMAGFQKDKNGALDLKIPGPDGQVLDMEKELQNMPYLKTEKELQEISSKIAWITNENAYGVDFFQNVTGFWANKKTVKGWPMEDQIEASDRNMMLGTTPEDRQETADLIPGFGNHMAFNQGRLSPR